MSIRDEIDRIKNAKDNIQATVESKGVTIPDEVKIDEYWEYIDQIEQGGGADIFIDEVPSDFKFTTMVKTIPEFDTENVTSMRSAFSNLTNLENIPELKCGKVEDMAQMFYYCSNLEEIPELDTSNVTNMSRAFGYCRKLKTIPLLDCGKVDNFSSAFYYCDELENLGGFKDIGKAYLTTASSQNTNYMVDLRQCTKLSHESVMNVINNLYDIKSKGCKTQYIMLSGNAGGPYYSLTDEEKQIAYDKGWKFL